MNQNAFRQLRREVQGATSKDEVARILNEHYSIVANGVNESMRSALKPFGSTENQGIIASAMQDLEIFVGLGYRLEKLLEKPQNHVESPLTPDKLASQYGRLDNIGAALDSVSRALPFAAGTLAYVHEFWTSHAKLIGMSGSDDPLVGRFNHVGHRLKTKKELAEVTAAYVAGIANNCKDVTTARFEEAKLTLTDIMLQPWDPLLDSTPNRRKLGGLFTFPSPQYSSDLIITISPKPDVYEKIEQLEGESNALSRIKEKTQALYSGVAEALTHAYLALGGFGPFTGQKQQRTPAFYSGSLAGTQSEGKSHFLTRDEISDYLSDLALLYDKVLEQKKGNFLSPNLRTYKSLALDITSPILQEKA